jgi:hypothetical protein
MPKEFLTEANFKAAVQANGSAGGSGQLFESQGSSSPPKWGRVITTSTSDPTGGADGDIWIKYTA